LRLSGEPSETREQWLLATASYSAARARRLALPSNPMPGLGLHQHHDGFGLLAHVLARAYGNLGGALMRPRLRQRLAELPCPRPTLIDGKMEPGEWIAGPSGLLKTDFEHHGMGKNQLNVVDPAYDLAEAILHLELSPEEEARLLRLYAEEAEDRVEDRLFLNKVLAGTWTMASALKALFSGAQPAERLHRQFVTAWHFLTVHAARYCGARCGVPPTPRWRSPLVVLDIDGVLDRRLFGFPCTTAAGIEALSLLHAHDFALAVDTARSVAEVKEYCRAYGLVGGAAEYGSYVWDAVNERGRVCLGPESLRQLNEMRQALARLPGVFLDDRYHYSIRAHTYEDHSPPLSRAQVPYRLSSIRSFTWEDRAPAPLPTLTVQQLLAQHRLDGLCFQQTTLDTTILAREVDKGSGLQALLREAGQADAETIAVGDTEPDLALFRVARRSFAPAQITCARLARSLGCTIARQPYQRGLLEVARSLVHPDGKRCPRCPARARPHQDLFLDLLAAADRRRSAVLLRALLDPKTYRVFVR
jgi:hydroxymethylpyrimidine pyrophosphatase-like HAD family hydrolase